MKRKVELLDTTFRDGMQHEKMSISLTDALKIVRRMAQVGFHVAELGFACANEFAQNLIQAALQEDLGQMQIAAFGRTRKPKEKVQDSVDVQAMLKLGMPVAVIVCKSRLMDVVNSLQTDQAENLAMIKDTVSYLKDQGLTVYLDLEHALDAYYGRGRFGELMDQAQKKTNYQHFLEVIEVGIQAGADCLVVCDTTGGASPEEVATIFNSLRELYPEVKFGFHGHNDNDLAVANSRAAVLSSACHIQGTINGYGERCGNLNLCSFVPRLQLKDSIPLVSSEALKQLTELSRKTALAFNRESSNRAPFVGVSAHFTSAGMHASSQDRDPGAYLQIHPELVGNEERVGISRQSGRANVALMAKKLGVPLNDSQLQEFMKRYSKMINADAFEASETSFILACRWVRGELKEYFEVMNYEVSTRRYFNESLPQAKAEVAVKVGKEVEHTVAFGNGPVDALVKALRKALRPFYPAIHQVHLVAYNLYALDVSEKETGAPVRVLAGFQSKEQRWETAGVSTDSNEAALMATVDGIQWFLYQEGNGNKHL